MNLIEMYPAKNGSPATALSANCSKTATSISVLSAAVLPPAPNLAVIGVDDTAEIIRYSAIDDNVLTGVTRGINGTTAKAWEAGTNVARNITSYDHDTFKKNIEDINDSLEDTQTDVTDLQTRTAAMESDIADLEAQLTFKRYGVSGVGLQTAALTRTLDAVGMTAEVGTDEAAEVTNDFDNAAPFMHRKCVGSWILDGDHAKFSVEAYLGDPGYSEDGSAGDYVAVELPLSFYRLSGNSLEISAHKYPGYRPFDIFCRNHNEAELLEKVYVPAYALALDTAGHAVSLPDLDPEQGHYAYLFTKARNYNNDDLAGKGMLMPAALQFYYWALMTVEFANQNCQAVMCGCSNLRNDTNDSCHFLDSTHVLVGNYYNARVAGEYVTIDPAGTDRTAAGYQATHRILSIVRADSTGAPSETGTYSNIEVEDLGKGYIEYDTTGATTYGFHARAWRTGSCNDVLTPSGSPVSNASGYYPMRYRYRENIYGNIAHTVIDLFAIRRGTSPEFSLDWYLLPDPTDIETPNNPTIANLESSPYIKLGLTTAPENYTNGYIVSFQHDAQYKDIRIPLSLSGGGSTKYYCDYTQISQNTTYRATRLGGYIYGGEWSGVNCFALNQFPSTTSALYGGDLYFPQ